MPCPTCDHTMEHVSTGPKLFWCPRCGTLLGDDGNFQPAKLVERCREFERKIIRIQSRVSDSWKSIGIDESIHIPEERLKIVENT